MDDDVLREPARDPQDLERLLVTRQRLGDLQGMAALYEQDAVLDSGDGQVIRGKTAIGAFFDILVSQGRKFEFGNNARPLSLEIWHSLQLAFPMAPSPRRSPGDKGMEHGYGSLISSP